MRHGTASAGDGVDHSRPLTDKGVEEVRSIGRQLLDEHLNRLAIFCSDALRTRQTYEQLRTVGLEQRVVHFENSFYLGDSDHVLQAVWTADDEDSHMLLIGHNPTWSQLVTMLSDQMVGLAPSHAALLRKDSLQWNKALSSPGWELVKVFKP